MNFPIIGLYAREELGMIQDEMSRMLMQGYMSVQEAAEKWGIA